MKKMIDDTYYYLFLLARKIKNTILPPQLFLHLLLETVVKVKQMNILFQKIGFEKQMEWLKRSRQTEKKCITK